jgi:hypothetical protein
MGSSRPFTYSRRRFFGGLLNAALACALIFSTLLTPAPARAGIDVYNWYIARWSDQTILCKVAAQHTGTPTSAEIKAQCGEAIHAAWQTTPPCLGVQSQCAGVYLFFSNILTWEPPKPEDTAVPEVRLSLAGCEPELPANWCAELPALDFALDFGEAEPSTAVVGMILLDKKSACIAEPCRLALFQTPPDGLWFQFWSELPDGRKSEVFWARLRVLPAYSPNDPDLLGWRVDLISTQWVGHGPACCGLQWAAFPPLTGLPHWLSTPDTAAALATQEAYYFLAGSLLKSALADGSACPANGVLPSGFASECGMNAAVPQVLWWQNAYDVFLLEAARDAGVPAVLLKRLIARESQFWPAGLNGYERGLGHLTEGGADTLLLWNPNYYSQLCPQALSIERCTEGYATLTESEQTLLRAKVLEVASAWCETCPGGVDMQKLDASVDALAQTLAANAGQAGQILRLVTGKKPGEVASYEDLWKFSLVNYNAGAGCLAEAVKAAWPGKSSLTWIAVSEKLPPHCQGAIDYVESLAADGTLALQSKAFATAGNGQP